MNPQQRFAVNEPTVIQEIIDGEAIIADLGRGFYYSLDASGSQVWNALVEGWSVAEIVEALSERLADEAEVIATGIAALVERLLSEALLVPLDEKAVSARPGRPVFAPGEVTAFVEPVLSKFTDMEQLLLLDPIHDVDETGWPNEAEPAATARSGQDASS